MPLHNQNLRLSHLDCLKELGWLSFDVTHMGEPDGHLMSPCCIHGYRAVWAPRLRLDWHRRGAKGEGLRTELGNEIMNPGDMLQYMTLEQRTGGTGSWVLVAGNADTTATAPPVDAVAKWWMTTQADANMLEEEMLLTDDPANFPRYGVEFPVLDAGVTIADHRHKQKEGNYLGQTYKWKHRNDDTDHWHSRGSLFPSLKRWTNKNEQAGAAGLGSSSDRPTSISGGIPDPGLGESSGLPGFDTGGDDDDPGGRSPFGRNIWWVLYGERTFSGITKCHDPRGANQERDDHWEHGTGSNWRGVGKTDYDVNNTVEVGQSADGGYTPRIFLFGGDIIGTQGTTHPDAETGDIPTDGFKITDPGIVVVTEDQADNLVPPQVGITPATHYQNFSAEAHVSDDYDTIKAAYDTLIKSKQDMKDELCDGYEDPIAQTFLVNGTQHGDGVFVPSIDVCFAGKPKWGVNERVILELRPTVNGHPHSEVFMAQTELFPEKVYVIDGHNVGEDGIVTLPAWENPMDHESGTPESVAAHNVKVPNFDEQYAYTRFEFDYPRYLPPGEYAIVIRSNDSAYKCWIAQTKGELITDDSLRDFDQSGYTDSVTGSVPVSGTYSRQYGGSFFRSQNGRTWTEDQEQDLMFRVNQCVFDGTPANPETGDVTFGIGAEVTDDFEYDRLQLIMNSMILPSESTKISAASFQTQEADQSEGTLTSLPAGSLFNAGGLPEEGVRRMPESMKIYSGKSITGASIKATFTLSTENSDVSPVLDVRSCYVLPTKNIINAGGLNANNISVVDGLGDGDYEADGRWTVGFGGSTTNAYFKTTVDANKIINDVIMTDSSYADITDEPKRSGTNFHHAGGIVSKTAGTGTGATFTVLSEEVAEGGNAEARYVTKAVNLAPGMSARALKVYLTAQQPYGSSIYVYYKALAEEDSEDITRKKWTLMNRAAPDLDFFSDEESSFVPPGQISGATHEYVFDSDELIEYTTDDGNTYDSFKTFAIKIVTMAQNRARVPIIQNFRTIAVS